MEETIEVMLRVRIFILTILVSTCCQAQVDTLLADIDNDGLTEMLVKEPFTSASRDTDTLMVIRAYRAEDGVWKEWTAFVGPALYATVEVGMEKMSMSFERGALVIRHGHTGFNYIDYTHRFRWQNDRFELIGATVTEGERFLMSKTFDYNLSTGSYQYEVVTYSDDEITGSPKIIKGAKIIGSPLLLDNFEIGTRHVKLHNGEVVAF